MCLMNSCITRITLVLFPFEIIVFDNLRARMSEIRNTPDMASAEQYSAGQGFVSATKYYMHPLQCMNLCYIMVG